MKATIAVAWLDRSDNALVWCRAKRKRTLSYQDSVATRCGHYVIAPCELSLDHTVTCEDCLVLEGPEARDDTHGDPR